MKKSNGYDGSDIISKNACGLKETKDVFTEIEALTAVLERMEISALTFRHFRDYPDEIIQWPSVREAKRGLFARIYTAEVWMNNKLKPGQYKVFWNKADLPSEEEKPEINQELS